MLNINAKKLEEHIRFRVNLFNAELNETIILLDKKEILNILKKKNPFLLKTKNITCAKDLVEAMLSYWLPAKEETLFGTILEELARYIAIELYGGEKSATHGIDIDFHRDNKRFLVAIKSGPNWGNSGQVAHLEQEFKTAIKVIGTNNNGKETIECIEGCCYGSYSQRDVQFSKKLCGQDFWEFLTNDPNAYFELLELMPSATKSISGTKAYQDMVERCSQEIEKRFCNQDKSINWNKLLIFNSGNKEAKKALKPKKSNKNDAGN